MKTSPAAYYAFEQILLTAYQASKIEEYVERISHEGHPDECPEWVMHSERLALLLSTARKLSGMLGRTLLAYAEEHIRLYRINEERPAPESRRPDAGDTPSAN